MGYAARSIISALFSITVVVSLTSKAQAEELIPDATLKNINHYKYWQASLPLLEDEIVVNMYLVDENLYVATNQSRLYCLQADVGVIRWTLSLGTEGKQIFRPYHVQSFWGRQVVLLTTSDGVAWYDRATGEKVAQLPAMPIPSASAISDGLRVYFPSIDQHLYCYEIVSHRGHVGSLLKWRIKAFGSLESSPVIWNDGLFFASHDGRIRACDALDKARRWVFNNLQPIAADMVVDSTGVYFGDLNRIVYKLDPTDGKAVWRFRTSGRIFDAPVLVGDLVFQTAEQDGLYVIDADQGSLSWRNTTAKKFISSSKDCVYYLSSFGEILALNTLTGDLKQQISAPGIDVVAKNESTPAMYLASKFGTILCAQNLSVPYLKYEIVQAKMREDQESRSGTATQEVDQPESEPETPGLKELLESKSQTKPLGG